MPQATRREVKDAVFGDIERLVSPGRWQDFRFRIEFAGFSRPRAATSWLRSADLAFFAVLGYRFVFRPELGVVRDRISNPEANEPATFRIIRPERSERTLVHIDEPETFASYAMLYGRNVIFLPRYRDGSLYSRLAAHPDNNVKLSLASATPGQLGPRSCTTSCR